MIILRCFQINRFKTSTVLSTYYSILSIVFSPFLLFFYLPCTTLLDADTNPSGAIPTSLPLDLENSFIWPAVVMLIKI
jgi:hypothetical protein